MHISTFFLGKHEGSSAVKTGLGRTEGLLDLFYHGSVTQRVHQNLILVHQIGTMSSYESV